MAAIDPPIPPTPTPPVPPDPSNYQLPDDPSTWNDLPSDVSESYAEDALVCISRYYFGGDVDVSSLKISDSQDLIDQSVNYLRFIDTMRTFYTVMGFLRIIFCIFLLIYQVNRYYMNDRLSWFQVTVLWMIQIISVVQIVYSFTWGFKVVINCEFWAMNTSSLIDVSTFLIGILVTYYMYTAINMIHQFSKKGTLPRELARKRLKCCMITLIAISAFIFTAFIICNCIFHARVEYHRLSLTNDAFAIIRAIGLLINATLLTATIHKLRSAKVHKSKTGHLNIWHCIILLAFMIMMTGSGLASSFVLRAEYPTISIGIDMCRDILDYLLAIMYFKMITKFITTFKLRTRVDGDGNIDIVGYDEDGHEVFKFNLDNEQHLNLLGFSREQINHNAMIHKHDEREHTKNQFEIITENSSQNDFSDDGDGVRSRLSKVSKSTTNWEGRSNFVTEYEGPKSIIEGEVDEAAEQHPKQSPMFGQETIRFGNISAEAGVAQSPAMRKSKRLIDVATPLRQPRQTVREKDAKSRAGFFSLNPDEDQSQ